MYYLYIEVQTFVKSPCISLRCKGIIHLRRYIDPVSSSGDHGLSIHHSKPILTTHCQTSSVCFIFSIVCQIRIGCVHYQVLDISPCQVWATEKGFCELSMPGVRVRKICKGIYLIATALNYVDR